MVFYLGKKKEFSCTLRLDQTALMKWNVLIWLITDVIICQTVHVCVCVSWGMWSWSQANLSEQRDWLLSACLPGLYLSVSVHTRPPYLYCSAGAQQDISRTPQATTTQIMLYIMQNIQESHTPFAATAFQFMGCTSGLGNFHWSTMLQIIHIVKTEREVHWCLLLLSFIKIM